MTVEGVRAELRSTAARIEELKKRRDEVIREGLAAGARAADLAEDARLSVPRIYQIRDGRR